MSIREKKDGIKNSFKVHFKRIKFIEDLKELDFLNYYIIRTKDEK